MKLTLAWLAPAKSRIDRFSSPSMEAKNCSKPWLARAWGCPLEPFLRPGCEDGEDESVRHRSFSKASPSSRTAVRLTFESPETDLPELKLRRR